MVERETFAANSVFFERAGPEPFGPGMTLFFRGATGMVALATTSEAKPQPGCFVALRATDHGRASCRYGVDNQCDLVMRQHTRSRKACQDMA